MEKFNEYETFEKICNLSKEQISKYFHQKELTLKNGEFFTKFLFELDGVNGSITSTYSIDKNCFIQIDMDYNFSRPAGYNNYKQLNDVIRHIMNNYE